MPDVKGHFVIVLDLPTPSRCPGSAVYLRRARRPYHLLKISIRRGGWTTTDYAHDAKVFTSLNEAIGVLYRARIVKAALDTWGKEATIRAVKVEYSTGHLFPRVILGPEVWPTPKDPIQAIASLSEIARGSG